MAADRRNPPGQRLLLSPPHLGPEEVDAVLRALASNWVAPLGPEVDAFEEEFARAVGAEHAVALASGTAALHLALLLAGVEPGDEVMVSTFTFVASVNPIRYLGATPVFVDAEPRSWNMDPDLLEEALGKAARRGRLPKAVVVAHMYGQCADLDPIAAACERWGVPLVEDAAEALGSRYRDQHPGTRGIAGAFSFNGNKIITTSGGGMLVVQDAAAAQRIRKLATQARDPAPHYQHSEVGFNYRLSNLLAALGRAQLDRLEQRVAARRATFEAYRRALADVPGLTFQEEVPWGRHTRWLSCLLVDPHTFGTDREGLRLALEAGEIESRPLWKPMHLQPVFQDCPRVGGEVAEQLFRMGLCLPSGSALTPRERRRVVDAVRDARRRAQLSSP